MVTSFVSHGQFHSQCLTFFNGYPIIFLYNTWGDDRPIGPDCSTGPKYLDPNYSRQPILWLHALCLKVLIVQGNELRLFGAKACPLLILISRVSDIAAVSTTVNVFSYDAVEPSIELITFQRRADPLCVMPGAKVSNTMYINTIVKNCVILWITWH